MIGDYADGCMSYLSESHRSQLRDGSGISDDVIKQRGYWTAQRREELEQIGFPKSLARFVPALVIPVHNVHGALSFYRIRPDNPRGKAKYLMPSGERMCLDIPPAIRPSLGDPSIDLWITEGEKKTDCAVSHGLCCIGLLGVTCWRGTNTSGGKTALADWDAIALNGRKVFIAFDNDVLFKPEVHYALSRLKQFLESRKAIVRIVLFPGAEEVQP